MTNRFICNFSQHNYETEKEQVGTFCLGMQDIFKQLIGADYQASALTKL